MQTSRWRPTPALIARWAVAVLLLLATPMPGWAQTIGSFTPANGPAGTPVIITGTNLNLVRGVRFGTGGLGLFTAQSATSLTVRVPVGAVSGVLRLTSSTGAVVNSATSFTYTPRPAGMVATLSPAGPVDACLPRALTGDAATPAFSMIGGSGISGSVQTVVLQPDGKILVGGSFSSWQGSAAQNIVRINANGSIDTGFNVASGFNSTVNSIALQADGKIVVGGRFSTYKGAGASRLVRLNPDGSFDGTFAMGTAFGAVTVSGLTSSVQTVVVQPDGKILVGGVFDNYNGQTRSGAIRLNADGSLDGTFNVQLYTVFSVKAIAVQDDGKLLLGGDFKAYNNDLAKGRFIRVNADGSLDAAFTPSGGNFYIYSNGANPNGAYINHIVVQADGKILAAGYFSSYNGTGINSLARVLPTGLIDPSFAPPGIYLTEAVMLTALSDGHILVGQSVRTNASAFVRLNSDGTGAGTNYYSATFASGSTSEVRSAVEQPDGKIVIGGYYDSYSNLATNGNATGHNSLVRVNADFSLNTAPTAVSGATFTFSPGSTTANPLVTSTVGTYSAVATLNGETSATTNAVTLTACPGPSFTAFSPATGVAGTLVTITGTNLGSIQGVRFGTGGLALFTAQSATSITVRVPVDAASGALTLTPAVGSALVTPSTFTYTPRPDGLVALLSPAGVTDICAPRTLTASAATLPFSTGTGFNNIVNGIAMQADGKVLVGGQFTSYNSVTGQNYITRLNADGSRDTGFGTGTGFNTFVQCVAVQADSKVMVGGQFTSYNGTTGQNYIVRLNTNGTRDATFAIGSGFNNTVNSIAVQADGKVLVVGQFTSYNGTTANRVVRLNTNGSIDATFVTGTGLSNQANVVALQADGKVLVGGIFNSYSGNTANYLVRLNANGSFDATFVMGSGFDNAVLALAVQTDGKVAATGPFTSYSGTAGQNRIIRLNANGSRDATFVTGTGFNGLGQALLLQADGKVLVGGQFTTYNGTTAQNYLIRLNTNGSRDATLGTGTGFNDYVTGLAMQADGKVVAGGNFASYNGTSTVRISRLNPDGSYDATPTPVSGATFTWLNESPQPGNPRLMLPYPFTYQVTATLNGVTSGGSNQTVINYCDPVTISGFTPTSGETGTVITVTGTNLQYTTNARVNGVDGAFTLISPTSISFVVAAGSTTGPVSVTINNTNGGTTSFGTFTVLNPIVSSFSPASGTAGTAVTLTGVNLDRVRGVRFGSGGLGLFTAQTATSLTVLVPVDAATGPLTVTAFTGTSASSAGSFTYVPRPVGLVTTLSSAGPLDVCTTRTLTASAVSPAFSTGGGIGNGELFGLAVQADGRILIGGTFTTYNGTTRNRLVRLSPDGTPDASFALGTGFNGTVQCVAVQADGKVLVGGDFTAFNSITGRNRLIRLNPDGTVDATFGTGFDFAVNSIVVQPDGKVLVGGSFNNYNGTAAARLVRLNADGSRDATFVIGSGFNGNIQRLALQADGKVLVGGGFNNYNGTAKSALVRLNANGTLDATFVTGSGVNTAVFGLAVQADGKVLVAGNFTLYNGTAVRALIRLSATGSLDAPFATGSGFNNTVWGLTLVPGGKILAAGYFTSFNGTARAGLAQLNADGTLDATFATGSGFNGTVYTTAVQADGRVLAGGTYSSYNGTGANGLVRLTTTGALDTTPTPVSGATFTFSPGNTTTNPLATIATGTYSAVASLNGETSAASNTLTIAPCPAPTITSFTPTSGSAGTVVTVTGTNLGYATAAAINGVAGTALTGNTGTSLTFTVGIGSSTGPLSVTTPGGTATGGTFTVDPVSITSFTPTSGGAGTVVTITGVNLLGATAVKVNGVAGVNITGNTATSLTFTVDAGSTTGPVSVTTPGGTATGATFTVDPMSITSFTPTIGGIGTIVTITGTNLGFATSVAVNGVAGINITGNTATSLTFTVAIGSTTGPVSVTTPGGTATGGTFTVVVPALSSFSPTSGPAGTLVTLTGANLDLVQGVRFGTGGLALFTAQSASSLTVLVPGDAATGPLTVTSLLGSGLTSASPFTYTPRPSGLLATLSPAGPLVVCATPATLTATAATPAFAAGTGFDVLVNTVVEQPDGKLLVGGQFLNYNGFAVNRLIRLNADGSRDATFNVGAGFDAAVAVVAQQADGKVLVGGQFTTYNGVTAANRLIRLNTDGSVDASFATGAGFTGLLATGALYVQSMVVQPDGKILVGGGFTTYNGAVANGLIRLNTDGSPDLTFATGSGFDFGVFALAMQSDGKVLAGGNFTSYNGVTGPTRLIRLNVNGTPDATFVTGSGFNSTVNCLAVQADGKILVGGNFTSYGTAGINRCLRLGTTGIRESTFSCSFNSTVNSLVVQPDGKILAGGSFTTYNSLVVNQLVRFGNTGLRDGTFVVGTGFNAAVRRIALLADGSVLAVGNFTTYKAVSAVRIIRLSTLGSPTNAATPVSGASFTFSPGFTTANPFVTSTAGNYSAVASLNGEISAASNTVILTACATPLPTVTALSVPAELPGLPITITGTGFTAGSTVSIGGVAAPMTYVSATVLTAMVPASATSGVSAVVVANATGSSSSSPAFTVLAVYDGGTLAACAAAVLPTASLNDGAWHYLLAGNGQVVAAYNYTGTSLGDLAVDVLRADPTQPVRQDARQHYYLDRNFHLTASGGRFDGRSIGLRLYGLTTELARLQAADPTATPANLKATQYSGPNEDCQLANNVASGERRTLAAPASSPAGTAYFRADVAVADHFSEFYLTGSATPLPVELVSFTADKRGTTVALAWATASEKNSARFEVERSRDGRTFERIGQVAAQGTSTSPHSYYFLDANYPGETDVLYYRLRQVDLDATFSYSPVRAVTVGGPTGLALFPNPTTGTATLTGAVPGTVVRVYDALGREVLMAATNATGTAALVLPRGLATGVYVVRVGSKVLRLTVE